MAKPKAQNPPARAIAIKAKAGDKVFISCESGEHNGILLPSSNPDMLAVKLSSGYNIGVSKAGIKKIEVL